MERKTVFIRAVVVLAIVPFCVPSVATFSQSSGMPGTSHPYWGFGGGGGLVHSITGASDAPESGSPRFGAVGYGSVGYDFGSIRTDAEFGIQSYLASIRERNDDIEAANIFGLVMMVNAWYEVESVLPFSPYFGIGAGATHISISEYDFDGNGWGFAYQAGVGVSVPYLHELRPVFYFGFGYRLFGILETEITGIESPNGKRFATPTILHCFESNLRLVL